MKVNPLKFSSAARRYGYSGLVFLALCAGLFVFNAVSCLGQLARMHEKRQYSPYIFLGAQFLGLGNVFRDVRTVGYYTDKSMNDRIAAMEFAQAQYVLAPVVLDLNNTDHAFVLFACSTPQLTLDIIRQKKLVPLRENQFGIVLARNPRYAQPFPGAAP